MASGPKLITLDPPKDLEFDLKNKEPVEQRLKITNISGQPISFKVKTTAPKAYLVRPSNDLLPAGKSVDIQILLQPLVGRDTPHRFLVQAVALTKNENLSKTEWQNLKKEDIYEQRLGVVEPKDTMVPADLMTVDTSNEVELQSKYEELVKYVLSLETETQTLENQRDTFRENLATAKEGGFGLWAVILAVILAVLLSKLPQYM